MTVAHPFARIAPAPYTFVSVVKSAQEVKAGRNAVEAFCEHCGSCIHNVVTFRGADGREFAVGLDCAKKAGEAVTKHAKIAKDAEILASAPVVLAQHAGNAALLTSKGAYLADTYGKRAAALVRSFKPFAKLGLVTIVKQTNNFGEQTGVRVIFTETGVVAFGGAVKSTWTRQDVALQAGVVEDGWMPVR